MKKSMWIFAAALTLLCSSAQASEVSLVSGLYKSENNKSDGKKTYGHSVVEVGGRYSEPYMDNMHWFAQGMLSLNSYSGDNAPSNSTGVLLRGGMRFYFNQFSESFIPYMAGSAGYMTKKTADQTTEVEESGLFYWGDIGLRMEVGQNYFFEVETNLFESALWATQKTKPVDDASTAPDTERSRTELYVDTSGAFTETTVGIGMRF